MPRARGLAATMVASSLVLASLAACSSFGSSAAVPVPEEASVDAGTDGPAEGPTADSAPPVGGEDRYPSAVRASVPALYFRLSEPGATDDAIDAIAPTEPGAVVNGDVGTRPGALAGAADTARSFANGHLERAAGFDSEGAKALSFEVWVRLDQELGQGVVVGLISNESFAVGGFAPGVDLVVEKQEDGTAALGWSRTGIITAATQPPTHAAIRGGNVTPSTWHHVVATYSGKVMALYLDGQSVAAEAVNVLAGRTDGPLYLGARRVEPNLRLPGSLDEIALYTRALSATEVSAHFEAARSR